MKLKHTKRLILAVLAATLPMGLLACAAEKSSRWQIHDPTRPLPPVVVPADQCGQPPSDAVILFDGKDLSAWQSSKDGGPAKWKVENGFVEVAAKTGDIRTKESFGSCQLHIEWATPEQVKGVSQECGNSGVFLMDKYEVQLLDSYGNTTYADGQAGAIYGQNPPLVNACKAPGQWQSYDIIFHAPVFNGQKVVKPATVTILHNGVLIQDHWEIKGSTFHKIPAKYEPHPDKMPIHLQDHGNPTRFRNIWIRPLPQQAEK